MARTREWRRWQSEKKLKKCFRWISDWNGRRFESRLFYSLMPVYTYEKRYDRNTMVVVQVTNDYQWQFYLRFEARKVRDNPKKCGCILCKGKRAYHKGRTKYMVNHNEWKSFEGFLDEMFNDDSIKPMDNSWKKY